MPRATANPGRPALGCDYYCELFGWEIKAESLGGSRIMGPEKIMDTVELGQFSDPEGHVIGVVKSA